MKIFNIAEAAERTRNKADRIAMVKERAGLYNLADYAYARDVRKAGLEIRDYFVIKNRQEQAWSVTTSIMSCLGRKCFTSEEAKTVAAFLSKKFGIRQSDIELAQKLAHSRTADRKGSTRPLSIVTDKRKNDRFYQLFLRLQAAIQENLLDYSEARALVMEMVLRYPETKLALNT